MKKTLLFIFIAFSANSYSQLSFEKGYYVDNSGNKIECLIKNLDWRHNPKEFQYKLSDEFSVETATIDDVSEFTILNDSKFIRVLVNIDKSSDDTNDLTYDKEPVFEENKLFLKVLLEGKANLYEYTDEKITKYFFSYENSDVEQLIYKRYKISDWKIEINNEFKQQLWASLKCSSIHLDKIRKLEYKKNNLLSLFTEYNECSNSENTIYKKKHTNDFFNLSIRPRLNISAMSLQAYPFFDLNYVDMGNNINFGIGIDAEFIFPFNRKKWSITLEPTFQHFKSNQKIFLKEWHYTFYNYSSVDYKSLEIPIGLRHYFHLSQSSKLFINTSFIFNVIIKSKFMIKDMNDRIIYDIPCNTQPNWAFGAGYKFNDKYSFEMRYFTEKNAVTNYGNVNSKYKTFSFIVGYRLF